MAHLNQHRLLLKLAVVLTLALICPWTLTSAIPLYAQSIASESERTSGAEVDEASSALANTFAGLVQQAVPRNYEKKKDWGKTKNITVGLRNEGLKITRRKKSVNHGVWKHYRIRMINPKETLQVQMKNLRAIDGGRVGFTLLLAAKLDTWARAKIYQYGIHLIALEIVGDADLQLAIHCEVGVRLQLVDEVPGVAIDPKVVDANLTLSNFHLRRVSNAKGPLVRELSSGLRRAIEHELEGPKLVAKLNRAIDKRRDRLELSMNDLLNSSWWPLASLPEVQNGMKYAR